MALLHSLGIRLVLVTCGQSEIADELKQAGIREEYHRGRMIVSEPMLPLLQAVCGRQRIRLESLMSMGLPNTPMHHSNIRIASGNHVIAKPLGILDGRDCFHTGTVRRVRVDFIRQQLAAGIVVHLSGLGYSVTGQAFSLCAEELAAEVAIALKADKLILLTDEPLLNEASEPISELSADQLPVYIADSSDQSDGQRSHLKALLQAVNHSVARGHLLDYRIDGVLLRELFSHQGCGLQVSLQKSGRTRVATLADIGGILELIEPLEKQGALISRSRLQLEQEIDCFMVVELDGLIIGCAALYPITGSSMAEVACLATSPEQAGVGESLLAALESRASSLGVKTLFVLTTQADHWFLEQGFDSGDPSDLPEQRRESYNAHRGSKVLIRRLA